MAGRKTADTMTTFSMRMPRALKRRGKLAAAADRRTLAGLFLKLLSDHLRVRSMAV